MPFLVFGGINIILVPILSVMLLKKNVVTLKDKINRTSSGSRKGRGDSVYDN